MSIPVLQSVLLWCIIINFGLLALWGLFMIGSRGWIYRLWSRVWRISPEQFDSIQFSGILLYKILIIVFNLVPYIALRIAA